MYLFLNSCILLFLNSCIIFEFKYLLFEFMYLLILNSCTYFFKLFQETTAAKEVHTTGRVGP